MKSRALDPERQRVKESLLGLCAVSQLVSSEAELLFSPTK